ncbi:regulator of G-protein signaling 14-like [Brienomyrus brachyistius]|uniref:regulator of G-protein signaling 14-like n=1 Tax=Brienomyrus brachyistius TaxID=42636 RepID=UPI0020B353C8|nr:regulator of G-protein signaling 14-like [Brienomyrus brachyistius]
MSKIFRNLAVPNGNKNLAVSDGELNAGHRDGRGSSHSLNSGSNLAGGGGTCRSLGAVASWAVSFERLLADPVGVRYFTAFLESEVSVENIQFWQACEKFRHIPASQKEELTRDAWRIFGTYLSRRATCPINIDDTARVQEKDLETPKPDIFDKAQQQIFKLMKFDSYTRFVRSPIYQSCMLANVEGRPLPEPCQAAKSPEPRRSQATDCPSSSDKSKKKLMPGKLVPFSVESAAEKRRWTPGKKAEEKRWDKRGSWGAEIGDNSLFVGPERQGMTRSSSGVQWTSTSSKSDTQPSSLGHPERVALGLTEKYCCVYLPDGTASLVATRAGVSVRDMLAVPCKKRGIPFNDVTAYLQSNTKEPLSMDLDSYVLKEQQVLLELQVTFLVEVAFPRTIVKVTQKSSKTLGEALLRVMQEHGIQPEEAVVTMTGSKDALDTTMNITSLANKKLQLDKARSKSETGRLGVSDQPALHQRQPATGQTLSADKLRPNSRRRNATVRRTYDMDGLMELLNRAQWCSADDQRGLLCKDHLELPEFLQLPLVECEEEGQEEIDDLQADFSLPTSPSERVPRRTRSTSSDPGSLFMCSESARETIV